MHSEVFFLILPCTLVLGERLCQYSILTCLDNLHWEDCSCFCQKNICMQLCCQSNDHFVCNSPPNDSIFKFLDCDRNNAIHQMLVKRCPANWTDAKTRTLCETPAHKSITDVRLVEVNYAGVDIVFRNKYCAICHNSELEFNNIPLYVNAMVCFEVLLNYIDVWSLTVGEAFLKLYNDHPNPCGVHSLPTLPKEQCSCDRHESNDITMQVLIDDNENATFTLDCPRKVMPDSVKCNFDEVYIDGGCRQIIQLDMCVDTSHFVYTVTGENVNDTTFHDLVSFRFLQLLKRYQMPASRLLKADVKTFQGEHVHTKEDCVEIHIFVTTTTPPGWNTTYYDGFLELPCDHDLNCQITFLPYGHNLLGRECDLNIDVFSTDRAWIIGPSIGIVLFLILTVV